MGLELPAYPTVPQQMPETVSVGSRYLNCWSHTVGLVVDGDEQGPAEAVPFDVGS